MHQFPKRKNIRLKDYDYSKPGMYFITICTKDRQCILSEIQPLNIHEKNNVGVVAHGDPQNKTYNKLMSKNVGAGLVSARIQNNVKLNKIGKIIEKELLDLENRFNGIIINKYVIMPNHIHIIIEIKDKNYKMADTTPAPTIADVICAFKSITATIYLKINRKNRMYYKLWQRNYYEHIIRNEKEYYKINKYIQNNPLKWKEDMFYKQ